MLGNIKINSVPEQTRAGAHLGACGVHSDAGTDKGEDVNTLFFLINIFNEGDTLLHCPGDTRGGSLFATEK